jgi:hypothetical protein
MAFEKQRQLVLTPLNLAKQSLEDAIEAVLFSGNLLSREREEGLAVEVMDSLNLASELIEIAIRMQAVSFSMIQSGLREKEAKREEEDRGAFGEVIGTNPFYTIPIADQPGAGALAVPVREGGTSALAVPDRDLGEGATQGAAGGVLEGSEVRGEALVPGTGAEREGGAPAGGSLDQEAGANAINADGQGASQEPDSGSWAKQRLADKISLYQQKRYELEAEAEEMLGIDLTAEAFQDDDPLDVAIQLLVQKHGGEDV